MKSVLITVIAFAVILYVLICMAVYFKQELFIFLPDKLPKDHQFINYPNAKEVYFDIEDNKQIHGLYFNTQNTPMGAEKAKGVVLYFHGNAGSLEKWGQVAPDFLPLGYDVLVMDYRTYGKSEGKLSEQNLFSDAQLAFNYLKQNFNERDIVIYGRSIGTGIATYLAANNKCKALILETPYYNLMDLAKNYFKWLPKKNLLKYPFRNDLHIKQVNSPAYIFHGTADKIVPLESGLKLEPFLEDGNFTVIQNANHHNISSFEVYHLKLKTILK